MLTSLFLQFQNTNRNLCARSVIASSLPTYHCQLLESKSRSEAHNISRKKLLEVKMFVILAFVSIVLRFDKLATEYVWNGRAEAWMGE